MTSINGFGIWLLLGLSAAIAFLCLIGSGRRGMVASFAIFIFSVGAIALIFYAVPDAPVSGQYYTALKPAIPENSKTDDDNKLQLRSWQDERASLVTQIDGLRTQNEFLTADQKSLQQKVGELLATFGANTADDAIAQAKAQGQQLEKLETAYKRDTLTLNSAGADSVQRAVELIAGYRKSMELNYNIAVDARNQVKDLQLQLAAAKKDCEFRRGCPVAILQPQAAERGQGIAAY